MRNLFNREIIAHISTTPVFKKCLIISVAIALAFPLYGLIFQMPSVSRLLINNLEVDAELSARYLTTLLAIENRPISDKDLSDTVTAEIENFSRDFQLEKITIYSPTGEILYSTDGVGIGTRNTYDYFIDRIAQGHAYTTVTKKAEQSLGAQEIQSEVIQVCVPMMHSGIFQGAFEIHRDITKKREKLNSWSSRSLLLLSGLAILVLSLTVLFMLNASRSDLENIKSKADLKEREEHYRTALDSVDIGYFEADLTGKLTFFNNWILENAGRTRKELLDMDNREYMTSISSADVFQAFNQLYQTGEPVKNIEFENILPNDEHRYRQISASIMKNTSDQSIGFRGIIQDITDRKQTEAELIQARDFLQHIMDSSIDCIVTTDLHGTITYCSSNSKTLIGYETSELIGQPVHIIYYKGKTDARQIMEGLTDKGELKHYELQVLKKGGGIIDIILSSSLLKNNKGEVIGTLGILKDITEKKKMESRLLQAQMLESISTLAGGVAHEFNNALMGITGNMELMKLHFPNDSPLSQFVEPVETASERMSTLTSQLLAYARGGRYNPRSVKIGDFLKDTIALIYQDMKPTIHLETDIPDNIANVIGDVAQMQMVLSAVLNNASEAMDGKGDIKISVRDGEIDEHFVGTGLELRPGFYVCIRIEDNGKGMDEETKSKIFDPFFTTKFQGRGLGMAAVYGIVTNHDGMISIDSELGKGTVVRIFLPGSKEKTVVKMDEHAQIELTDGPLSVLVVEDEAIVMDVDREMLKQLAYDAVEAKTGNEAVAIARNNDIRIDLAILDIKLPDMSGEEVYKRLVELRPGLKVILCSGYSIDGPAQEILNLGANGFIQKPFSLSSLSEKIVEVLNC